MCGISGILGEVGPGDETAVAGMNAMLVHRGPDGNGISRYPGAILGHTRLAIIDLTEQASQPMSSPDGRFVLVYNGEIYNYKELRNQLSAHHVFRSNSDTEVLLAAWLRWGRDCLQYLDGMFAFCIYDTKERSAFLARDRFGQKPLFIATKGKKLFFASEIKALLAAGIKAEPDRRTWARYLASASYDDDQTTFFKGISQLLPGECAKWQPEKKLERRLYYRVIDRVKPLNVSFEQAVADTRELLVDAARIHMRADVPVAVSLSGGLDSSALLTCLDSAGELNSSLACLSVEFGGDLTERHWVEAAAAHHNLPTKIHTYNETEFRNSIEPMMWHLEGPLGGLMNSALSTVMELAHVNGFKVIQDGTGLDEAFGGYRNHHNLFLGLRMREDGNGATHDIAAYARNWGVDESDAQKAAMSELSRSGTTIDGTVPVRHELLSSEVLKNGDSSQAAQPEHVEDLRLALADYLQVRKIPRNTRMKDRMSMGFGLELRIPFLDHRLIEYALSLPPSYYFHEGRSKSIVREALAGEMDDEVRVATKRSIQAPQGLWLMKEPMRSYIKDIVFGDRFASRGFFDVDKVREAFKRFCTHGDSNSFYVWQWINLEEWFRTFVDADAVTKQAKLCLDLKPDKRLSPLAAV